MGNELSPKTGDNSEDFEFEIRPLSWAGAGSRRWRRIAAGIAIVLAIILAFDLALNGPSASSTAQSSAPTPDTSNVTATALSLPRPSPTPPISVMEPVPSSCPAASNIGTMTLGEMTYYGDPAFGSPPVWMVGLSSDPTSLVVHFVERYPPLLYTSNGWRWRILVVSAPGYTKGLTLSGEETGSGKNAALYMDAGRGLVAKIVLNASQPIMRGVAWAEWPIYVYLPKAGCYQLAAQWQGGSWSIYFAAGA